jgi:hypothetical protein
MSDAYAWGEPDADGIALGLSVTSIKSYRIAIANRSSEPRAVVVFATLDDKFRTRIIARQADREEAAGAIGPAVPISSNVRIVIELAPGQIVEREGLPAKFKLTGEVTLQAVLGGVQARPELLTSGQVSATL